MRKIVRLNEEIARWAFEVVVRENKQWIIAFTNPTAGPWKTIKAPSKKTSAEGEVYRFALEEDRPDIIMFNDELKAVLIVEAKDSIKKLMEDKQAKKSAEVVEQLAGILGSKSTNLFWNGRENYKVILGLLWGSSTSPESAAEKNQLYDYYHNLVKDDATVYASLVIGIETLCDEQMKCTVFYKGYDDDGVSMGEQIVKSLL